MKWLVLLCLPVFALSQKQTTPASFLQDTATVGSILKYAAKQFITNPDTVLSLTKYVFDKSGRINYIKGQGDALIVETRFHRTRGDYEEALQSGLLATRKYEEGNQTNDLALALLEIAQIYKDMSGTGDTKEYTQTGLTYSTRAYNLLAAMADTGGMVYSLNMKGILYRDKAKAVRASYYDSALAMYEKAFNLMHVSGKGTEHAGKLYNNISQVYLEYKHDYKTALRYLHQAVAFNKAHNKLSSLSYNYGNMSNAYSSLNDHKNALKYAHMMAAATLQEGFPSRIQNAYRQLYASFKASGQADSALHYYILSDAINDSLTNVEKTQQVMKLQVQYETAKKQEQINTLHKEGADQKRRISILILLISIIGCSVVAMVWLYQRVNRQKKMLALQSHRLEVLMKELHHRVKNNLQIVSSLLSLQTYKLRDEEAISVLRESQQRVQAMSLIHQRLYTKDSITQVNMNDYINDLVESLVSSYGYSNGEVAVHVNIQTPMLDVEKALPIGLLINEMVTNSLKYAFDDAHDQNISIELNEQPDGLQLLVSDNGKGIDLAKWQTKGGSFGKQLINVLSKQLRASQNVQVENGTRFTIFIPGKAA